MLHCHLGCLYECLSPTQLQYHPNTKALTMPEANKAFKMNPGYAHVCICVHVCGVYICVQCAHLCVVCTCVHATLQLVVFSGVYNVFQLCN